MLLTVDATLEAILQRVAEMIASEATTFGLDVRTCESGTLPAGDLPNMAHVGLLIPDAARELPLDQFASRHLFSATRSIARAIAAKSEAGKPIFTAPFMPEGALGITNTRDGSPVSLALGTAPDPPDVESYREIFGPASFYVIGLRYGQPK